MQSSNQSHFSHAPQAEISRSTFNRSFQHKTTFDAGYLVPIFADEALPGDTFSLTMNSFARLATPIFPIMDNMYSDTFFFAVPCRLLWDNWQKFNGERRNPDDSIDYLVPSMTSPSGGYANQSIHDYLGIPTQVEGLEHMSLYHRAYNLIYNEWFRSENLQDSVPMPTGDGPDNPDDFVLRKRCKRHDYFTSCLPWPQKGDSVDITLTGNAPVRGIGNGQNIFTNGPQLAYETGANASTTYDRFVGHVNESIVMEEDPNNAGYPNVYADLSAISAVSINDLRQAFQLQRMLERDARGGTRYTEILRSHFGVTSPDSRLQRPEYLGGGSTPININPIAQTSSTDDTSPLGNLGAFGTFASRNRGFFKSFTEHCVIIGLQCVRADLNYQHGLNKMFSRKTRHDFYWPVFSHLGEQAVLNKEIYAQGTPEDEQAFGYQERYAEYRYKPNQVSGQFRSNFAQTLDGWHLAQNFTALPALNSTFIEENPPLDRIKAVTNEYPDFIFDSYFQYTCTRPMPAYSVPGLIDHF